ncbi:hypothetical protein TNIN_146101 [Trichonephila inaurata madagascariensis]|uniref:Uncharacterized protein n=1 Tax=Trichonephila inaurata madagascariensis TaxID=2747483 RepID=A0A8X6YY14_9ARAC|nr:hypothetical protein TNIN_146101 [Trichonephila inaurata madagascariensis]
MAVGELISFERNEIFHCLSVPSYPFRIPTSLCRPLIHLASGKVSSPEKATDEWQPRLLTGVALHRYSFPVTLGITYVIPDSSAGEKKGAFFNYLLAMEMNGGVHV